MPLRRPNLAEIRKRVISDFEYEGGSQAARMSGTVERAFVESVAGASHGLHGRISWIALNAFPQSAEDDQLVKIAAFYGVYQREATRSTGLTRFVQQGGDPPIPIGTRWIRPDGVEYETIELGEFGGESSVNVASRAVVAGANGDCSVTTQGVLASPIAGVHSAVSVGGLVGFTGGTDAESPLELRTRLLERLADPPNGGGPGSYIGWAKEVAGVTRAWEFGKLDENGDLHLGCVTVLCMRDNDADPFPSDSELDEIREAILASAPQHLLGLHVGAPIKLTVELTLEITPDTSALRDAVVEAIQNMLATRAQPPAEDGATFYKSWITTAISEVDGLEDYKLTVPTGDVTVNQFELVTIEAGDITWA